MSNKSKTLQFLILILMVVGCIKYVKVPVPVFYEIAIPEIEVKEQAQAVKELQTREEELKEKKEKMWVYDIKTDSYIIKKFDLALIKNVIVKTDVLCDELLNTIIDYNSKSKSVEEVKQ